MYLNRIATPKAFDER